MAGRSLTAPPLLAAPRWLITVGFIVLCNAAGIIGTLVGGQPSMYTRLEQPSFAPPPWVFAPVWITLYSLMGLSAALVWFRSTGERRRAAMLVFFVQLGLNAAWTPVFFGLGQLGLGFVLLIAIVIASATMALVFARISRLAGALTIPLVLWVSFAAVLNGAIWRLNAS